MQFLKVALIVIGFIGVSVYMVCVMVAYSRRANKSPVGGFDILTGRWLFYPNGREGISKDHRETVFWARVAFVVYVSAFVSVGLL